MSIGYIADRLGSARANFLRIWRSSESEPSLGAEARNQIRAESV